MENNLIKLETLEDLKMLVTILNKIGASGVTFKTQIPHKIKQDIDQTSNIGVVSTDDGMDYDLVYYGEVSLAWLKSPAT